MARHAATAVTPFRIPAHYYRVEARDFPLALLVEDFDGVGEGLPVAYGVTLLADARYPDLAQRAARACVGASCEGCSEAVTLDTGAAVEVDASGGGNPLYFEAWHLTCLTATDHYGIVPTSAVEWVGVE